MMNSTPRDALMKPYPLGIDNPIRIVQFANRWYLKWKDTNQTICSFASQFDAYDARRHILKSQGYNV